MSKIPSSNCVRGKKGRMRELRRHLLQEACLEVQWLWEAPCIVSHITPGGLGWVCHTAVVPAFLAQERGGGAMG